MQIPFHPVTEKRTIDIETKAMNRQDSSEAAGLSPDFIEASIK